MYVTNGDDKYGAASSLKELIQLEMGMDNIEIEVLNTEHNRLNKWCDERKLKIIHLNIMNLFIQNKSLGLNMLPSTL